MSKYLERARGWLSVRPMYFNNSGIAHPDDLHSLAALLESVEREVLEAMAARLNENEYTIARYARGPWNAVKLCAFLVGADSRALMGEVPVKVEQGAMSEGASVGTSDSPPCNSKNEGARGVEGHANTGAGRDVTPTAGSDPCGEPLSGLSKSGVRATAQIPEPVSSPAAPTSCSCQSLAAALRRLLAQTESDYPSAGTGPKGDVYWPTMAPIIDDARAALRAYEASLSRTEEAT